MSARSFKFNTQIALGVINVMFLLVGILLLHSCGSSKPVINDVISKRDTVYMPGKVSVKVEYAVDKKATDLLRDSLITAYEQRISGKDTVYVPFTKEVKIPIRNVLPVTAEVPLAKARAYLRDNRLILELEQKDTVITELKDSLNKLILIRDLLIANSNNKNATVIKYPRVVKAVDYILSRLIYIAIALLIVVMMFIILRKYKNIIISKVRNMFRK